MFSACRPVFLSLPILVPILYTACFRPGLPLYPAKKRNTWQQHQAAQHGPYPIIGKRPQIFHPSTLRHERHTPDERREKQYA